MGRERFSSRVLLFSFLHPKLQQQHGTVEGQLTGRQWANKLVNSHDGTITPSGPVSLYAGGSERQAETQHHRQGRTQVSTAVAEEILLCADEVMETKSRGRK